MNERRMIRAAGAVLFGIYLFLLMYILFLYRLRTGTASDTSLSEYARFSTNVVPFHTIRIYWEGLRRTAGASGSYWRNYFFRNLVGNLVLFFPMGIFLPALFPKLRSFVRTMLMTAFLVICVEGLQLLTRTGSCDVDDLILNLCGCAIGYACFFLAFRILCQKTDVSGTPSR